MCPASCLVASIHRWSTLSSTSLDRSTLPLRVNLARSTVPLRVKPSAWDSHVLTIRPACQVPSHPHGVMPVACQLYPWTLYAWRGVLLLSVGLVPPSERSVVSSQPVGLDFPSYLDLPGLLKSDVAMLRRPFCTSLATLSSPWESLGPVPRAMPLPKGRRH